MKQLPGWPEFCMVLMGVALVGIGLAVALLGRGGVEGSFALAGLSFFGLITGVVGLIWWALLDALRRPLPPEERILYVGLIFLLVPVGAILYYWLVVRSASSQQSPTRD